MNVARNTTAYAEGQDWIFASARMKGRQPLWPEAIMRNYVCPAAPRAGITKHISWHVFRHTFSTLLAENDEDVKTVQSLMRHASSITMDIYTHAVSSKKRRAQAKVVEMILPNGKRAVGARGAALCVPFCAPCHSFESGIKSFLSGDDETRTRDLCRDSERSMSTCKDLQEHGRHRKSLKVRLSQS